MQEELLQGSLDDCARQVLDAVPIAMRAIRRRLRSHGAVLLSVPQYRTMLFIRRNSGTSLSDVAEHIGLTLPSMSVLVDGLVERGFVNRKTHRDDRRRMNLTLTDRGEATIRSALKATEEDVKAKLSLLSDGERTSVARGMRIIKQIFSEEGA